MFKHNPLAGLQRTPTAISRAVPTGAPLPADLRCQAEALFDTDLGDVRIHVRPEVARVGALAYTAGRHIYFAPGQYDPGSATGLRILGHELAHVVQQRSGRTRNSLGYGVVVVRDPALEAEADRLGEAFVHRVHRAPPAVIQRMEASSSAPPAVDTLEEEVVARTFAMLARVSPGDTLRFLHALQCGLDDGSLVEPIAIVASHGAAARAIGLWSGDEAPPDWQSRAGFPGLQLFEERDAKNRRLVWMRPDDRADFLEPAKLPVVNDKQQVYPNDDVAKQARTTILWAHTCLGHVQPDIKLVKVLHAYEHLMVQNRGFSYWNFEWPEGTPTLLDEQCDNFTEATPRLHLQFTEDPPPSEEARFSSSLLFVRGADSHAYDNTPDYHLTIVPELLHSQVLLAGQADQAAFTRVLDTIHRRPTAPRLDLCSFGACSYLQQIRYYRRFQCAIGVNSSALDLAAASGIRSFATMNTSR